MSSVSIVRFFKVLLLVSVAIFMLSPLIVVVLVSFSQSAVFNLPTANWFDWDFSQWSLKWYRSMLTRHELMSTLSLSIVVASAATLASLVLGTLCAYAIEKGRFKGRETLLAFLVSPLMMPGLVVGVAMLQAFRAIGLYDVVFALVLGHIVITLPYITRTVHASLNLFDAALIEAAQTLGTPKYKAIVKVMVPALSPAFLTSGLFSFLASMDNYPISIFFTTAREKTLPIEILKLLEESPDPTIAAISACLILLSILTLYLAQRLVGIKRLVQF
jgi:putative spermidine/putrescine transport system permease protein